MKTPLAIMILSILLLTGFTIKAQVSISDNGNLPDNSAMLDVTSTGKGVLIPRMTSSQRDNIPSPAIGLIVYVTTDGHYYYHNGSSWQKLVAGFDDDWTVSGNDMYTTMTGNLGIGTSYTPAKVTIVDGFTTNNTVEEVLQFGGLTPGTPLPGTGTALGFVCSLNPSVFGTAGKISTIMEVVNYPTAYASGMLFQTLNTSGPWIDALYLDPDGNAGIGTRDPGCQLEIVGDNSMITLNANTGTSPNIAFEENGSEIWTIEAIHSSGRLEFSSSSHSDLFWLGLDGHIDHDYEGSAGNALNSSGTTSAAMFAITNSYAGNTYGLSAGMISASAGSTSGGVHGYNHGIGYGVYGESDHSSGKAVYGMNTVSSNFGYFGSADYGAVGQNSNGNYGQLGLSGFGIHGKLETTVDGNYAVYGEGIHVIGENGTGYSYNTSMGGVMGRNYRGNNYTFGVAGFKHWSYIRSGGVLGANNVGTIWGSLSYKNSGGTEYGGYFTTFTSGTGKVNDASIDVGLGAWGDLFGADIHGNIYGLFAEGNNYAMFANGDVYNNGLEIHLQQTEENQNTPLYTLVSEDAMVQTCGYATLNNGSCSISFDEGFAKAVSQVEPIIVTVTPHGDTKGVYLATVDNEGFTIVENEAGKSNVMVSFIAMGKRAGYEKPVLSREVVSPDYITKLQRGLHNDADTDTEGEGLFYENGKLSVGIHPDTFKEPEEPATGDGEE